MSDTTSSNRFDYLVNLDSTFLEGLGANHPRVVHRADCAYLTNDESKKQMLPVTGEVVTEWHRRWGDRGHDYHIVGFCQRCVVTPDGVLR